MSTEDPPDEYTADEIKRKRLFWFGLAMVEYHPGIRLWDMAMANSQPFGMKDDEP